MEQSVEASAPDFTAIFILSSFKHDLVLWSVSILCLVASSIGSLWEIWSAFGALSKVFFLDYAVNKTSLIGFCCYWAIAISSAFSLSD